MVADAVMFFQPDRIESKLFAINRFFQCFLKIRAAFSRNKSKFHGSIPVCKINITRAGSIGGEDHLFSIRRERRMRMAALVVAKGIRVVPTEYFDYLLYFAQMYFGDAAWSRFAVRNHCFSVRVEVVMTISAPRRGVIGFQIFSSI